MKWQILKMPQLPIMNDLNRFNPLGGKDFVNIR